MFENTQFLEVQKQILPCLEPRDRIERLIQREEPYRPLWHPLTGELGVVYVVHHGEGRNTVRHADVARWGIAEPLIRLVAQENLRGYKEMMGARIVGETGGPLLLVHHPELPVAAAIDDPEFRAQLKALLGESPLIALPRRNVLLAIGASNEQGRPEFIEQARKLCGMAVYPLCGSIIRIDGANLQVVEEYEPS